MIHPDTELQFISNEIGYGVVATKPIPKGTVAWVLDKLDREFTPFEIASMDGLYRDILSKYCFRNSQGNYILCWDNARYVNHSFNSNCLTTAYDFEVVIRDIQPGEQITDDYGYLNITEPFRAIDEGRRRKVVYPDDTLRYYKIWDKKLVSAMKRLRHVEQPLQPLIAAGVWEHVLRVSEGKEEMASIANCYYPGPAQPEIPPPEPLAEP